MKQPTKEEMMKFCAEVRKQRPDITTEEMKSLLASYFNEKKTTLEQPIIQQEKVIKQNSCSACGADNQPETAFCIACGKKLGITDTVSNGEVQNKPQKQDELIDKNEKVESKSVKEQKICKSCEAEIADDAAFCVACGKPIGESDVKKKKYHFVGTICSHCERSIEIRQPVTVCPKCGEPHHSECWKENDYTCAVPECGGRERVSETNSISDAPPAQPTDTIIANQAKDTGAIDANKSKLSFFTRLGNGVRAFGGVRKAVRWLVFIFVIIAFVFDFVRSSNNNLEWLRKEKPVSTEISVMIRKQYDENPAKADERLKNKVIQIKGYVSKIEKNGNGYKVSIDDSTLFRGYNVYCYFDKSQADEVSKLKVGNRILVKTIHSKNGGNLDFSPTVLVEVN